MHGQIPFLSELILEQPFDVEIEPVIENEQEVIYGEITLNALDTGEGVDGILVTIYLESENGSRLDEPLYLRTEDGVVEFEFNSDPPYGDTSEYGEVTVKMLIGSNSIISVESMSDLTLNLTQESSQITHTKVKMVEFHGGYI